MAAPSADCSVVSLDDKKEPTKVDSMVVKSVGSTVAMSAAKTVSELEHRSVDLWETSKAAMSAVATAGKKVDPWGQKWAERTVHLMDESSVEYWVDPWVCSSVVMTDARSAGSMADY